MGGWARIIQPAAQSFAFMKNFGVWLTLLAGVSGPAWSQSPAPVSTDGPTISRNSHVVGQDVIVVECHGSYSSSRDGQSPALTVPVVLRGGVSDNFELRLETNGLSWQGNSRGLADMTVGFKYEVVPDLALIGLVTLPTASPILRTPRAVPYLGVAHDHPLGDCDGLLFNAGLTWLADEQTQGMGTIVYSRTVTEDVAWFLESALIGNDLRLDTGLQIWTSSDFVINLLVLRGLSSGQDWGGTIGFGTRF